MPEGTVFIAPKEPVPSGERVDPALAVFEASWQIGSLEVEAAELVSARAAIDWGRERSDTVLLRLGHTEQDVFSAGSIAVAEDGRPLPVWPPDGPPPGGWWHPPPVPSLSEIERLRSRVEAGDQPRADAARWAWGALRAVDQAEEVDDGLLREALIRLLNEIDEGPPPQAPPSGGSPNGIWVGRSGGAHRE